MFEVFFDPIGSFFGVQPYERERERGENRVRREEWGRRLAIQAFSRYNCFYPQMCFTSKLFSFLSWGKYTSPPLVPLLIDQRSLVSIIQPKTYFFAVTDLNATGRSSDMVTASQVASPSTPKFTFRNIPLPTHFLC